MRPSRRALHLRLISSQERRNGRIRRRSHRRSILSYVPGGLDLERARFTARLLLMGELNMRMIGIPTPYVFRYPSKILVENVREGASVRNHLKRSRRSRAPNAVPFFVPPVPPLRGLRGPIASHAVRRTRRSETYGDL